VGLFHQPELCPSACRRLLGWALKRNPGYVVFSPNGFAGVDGPEIVKAEFEIVRQLVGLKGQFNTKAAVGAIVHDAKICGVTRRK